MIVFSVTEVLRVEMDLHIFSCSLITFSRTVLLLQNGFGEEGGKHFVAKFILIFMSVWYRNSREYASDVSVLTTH